MTRLVGSSKLLRAMNESATLALLLDRGSLTRGELRNLTGLSKPTTSEVLRRLTEAGLAVLSGHTSGGPGPNAEIYAANPAAGHAAAVTVRETADPARACLSSALCDLAGTVVARSDATIDFGAGADPAQVVSAAVEALCVAAGSHVGQVQHVELGLPGSYDATTGSIRHIDVPGWDRPGLVDDLARRLDATIGVENDVNLAAIAERSRGVAGDCDSFVLIWFGHGLGLAIDLNGSLVRGARGGAGEIGYMPVGLTSGGRRTDLQDLLGGPAVLALAAEHGVANAVTPEAVVAAAVRACQLPGGTPGAAAGGQAFLDALAERIAWGVAAVAAVLDPALIVLAGELARAGGDALTDRVTAALRAATPLDIAIAVTAIPDDPVLLGALDAALQTVRTTLINNLRNAVPAA
jgi:predicted NBD/HSP70 family sugar kinase/DNA-binding transcriptional ArsR family regulator